MSTRKLVLLALLGGGMIGLYYAGAPAVTAAAAPDGDLRGTALAVPGRLWHGLGVTGAKIVAPAVRKMVAETEIQLTALRQDLRTTRTTASQLATAREGVRQIQVMDSTALAGLEEGRPVQAFKLAMQANGLVGAVHGNLRSD